jgi:hypothetical protein
MTTSNIRLTPHAVQRFQERCRPALELGAAAIELGRLLGSGRIETRAPEWHASRAAQTSELYLVIGDDLVLPLERDRYAAGRWVAKTCLDRGGISDAARAHRNERKRRRRRARTAQRGGDQRGVSRRSSPEPVYSR